jgi:hypothetical protein
MIGSISASFSRKALFLFPRYNRAVLPSHLEHPIYLTASKIHNCSSLGPKFQDLVPASPNVAYPSAMTPVQYALLTPPAIPSVT